MQADRNHDATTTSSGDEELACAESRRWTRRSRIVVYAHLLGVVASGLLCYLDRHPKNPLAGLMAPLALWGLGTFFVCPIAAFVLYVDQPLRDRDVVAMVLLTCAMELAQFIALVPAVQ